MRIGIENGIGTMMTLFRRSVWWVPVSPNVIVRI